MLLKLPQLRVLHEVVIGKIHAGEEALTPIQKTAFAQITLQEGQWKNQHKRQSAASVPFSKIAALFPHRHPNSTPTPSDTTTGMVGMWGAANRLTVTLTKVKIGRAFFCRLPFGERYIVQLVCRHPVNDNHDFVTPHERWRKGSVIGRAHDFPAGIDAICGQFLQQFFPMLLDVLVGPAA